MPSGAFMGLVYLGGDFVRKLISRHWGTEGLNSVTILRRNACGMNDSRIGSLRFERGGAAGMERPMLNSMPGARGCTTPRSSICGASWTTSRARHMGSETRTIVRAARGESENLVNTDGWTFETSKKYVNSLDWRTVWKKWPWEENGVKRRLTVIRTQTHLILTNMKPRNPARSRALKHTDDFVLLSCNFDFRVLTIGSRSSDSDCVTQI